MDVEIFFELARKKDLVAWNREKRRERFVLFSISGFTDRLLELAKERTDLLLVGGDGRVQIDGSDSDKRVADKMITFQ